MSLQECVFFLSPSVAETNWNSVKDVYVFFAGVLASAQANRNSRMSQIQFQIFDSYFGFFIAIPQRPFSFELHQNC